MVPQPTKRGLHDHPTSRYNRETQRHRGRTSPRSRYQGHGMGEQGTRGRPDSWDQLAPLVYTELHEIAERALRRERPGHTLQATALVHEALLRMREQRCVGSGNRLEFLTGAA